MFNKMIPEEIIDRLTEMVEDLRAKDYDIRIDETGFGFTAYPIGNDDGTYDVNDTAYSFDVDNDEDGYWTIFEQHRGMLPGCFWTERREH